jgi:SAM-dependent methyltransferase
MITYRRNLLDKALENSITRIKGKVLDIGGKKTVKRGRFRPPIEKVESWQYLNPDSTTHPDYCCSAGSIPLEGNSINTVIMTEVLQYLPDPDKVLKEVFRILSTGGVFLVSTPYLVPIHADYRYDRQRFTALKLEEMFKKAEFKDIEIEPMGSLGAVMNDILHVYTGYSQNGQESVLFKILRFLLKSLRPLFICIDTLTIAQKKYITTGYFITAIKPDIPKTKNPTSQQTQ